MIAGSSICESDGHVICVVWWRYDLKFGFASVGGQPNGQKAAEKSIQFPASQEDSKPVSTSSDSMICAPMTHL